MSRSDRDKALCSTSVRIAAIATGAEIVFMPCHSFKEADCGAFQAPANCPQSSRARIIRLMNDSPTQHMRCMEVCGGSQLTTRGIVFGGLDAWVYSKPHGQAQRGGDVYYASSCAAGRISRILLADVSGHGTSVAGVAADLRTLMRRFINRWDQAEFVRLLNERFSELSETGAFATAIVSTFFAPSRRLILCNAGHPRPILYRASRQEWTLLGQEGPSPSSGPTNLPLGILSITAYEHF